jgi:hypothetical protein
LPVKVGIISGVLFDDELNHTNEVEFYAFCAIDDRSAVKRRAMISARAKTFCP